MSAPLLATEFTEFTPLNGKFLWCFVISEFQKRVIKSGTKSKLKSAKQTNLL